MTFTSSSTVTNFKAAVGTIPPAHMPRFVSIGPITSATARDLGYTIAAEAAPHNIVGLVAAVLQLASTQ